VGRFAQLDLSSYVVLTEHDPIASYAITGALPPGLQLDTNSGIVSGTPTAVGTTTITWIATDDDGASVPDSVRFTVSHGSTGGADPGLFRGTWRPPGTTNTYVVDQSELNGHGSVTSFPGCVNQRSQVGSNYCGPSVQDPIAGVLTMAQGTTLAIRFLANPTIVAGQYFKLAGGDGSGVPAAVEVSLSLTPADFNTNAACRKSSLPGHMPLIIVGPTACAINPQQLYYFNVRTTSSCGGGTCRFKLLEPASMTL